MKYAKLIPFIAMLLGSIIVTLIPWFARFTWIRIGAHTIRFDYIFHFVANGILILYFFWYISRKITLKLFLLLTFIGVSFSFLIELIQLTIPYRDFSYKDFICSSFGIMAGSFTFWIYQQLSPQLLLKNRSK